MTEDETTEESAPAKRQKAKRRFLVLGVVGAVIVVAGIGMFAWHNQPSFCGTLCHMPMSTYEDTYFAAADTETVDKWGNAVSDSDAMLAVGHREGADITCLDCHTPSISQQVGEVVETITGNYYYPLSEVSVKELMDNSNQVSNATGDEFCLNESCHNMTRDDLATLTADMTRNPHDSPHAENACSDCHKSHRASVMLCSECHADAEIPDGWMTADEGEAISQSIYS